MKHFLPLFSFPSHTLHPSIAHPSSLPPHLPLRPSSSIWMQLLNRRQTELRLIVLPLASFCVNDTQGQGDTPVDSPPTELPMGHLILQEKAQDWLNVRMGGDFGSPGWQVFSICAGSKGIRI